MIYTPTSNFTHGTEEPPFFVVNWLRYIEVQDAVITDRYKQKTPGNWQNEGIMLQNAPILLYPIEMFPAVCTTCEIFLSQCGWDPRYRHSVGPPPLCGCRVVRLSLDVDWTLLTHLPTYLHNEEKIDFVVAVPCTILRIL